MQIKEMMRCMREKDITATGRCNPNGKPESQGGHNKSVKTR
jgi:hypothetical protein